MGFVSQSRVENQPLISNAIDEDVPKIDDTLKKFLPPAYAQVNATPPQTPPPVYNTQNNPTISQIAAQNFRPAHPQPTIHFPSSSTSNQSGNPFLVPSAAPSIDQLDYLKLEKHSDHQKNLRRVLWALENRQDLNFTLGIPYEEGLPEVSENVLKLTLTTFRVDGIAFLEKFRSKHMKDLPEKLYKQMNKDIKDDLKPRIDSYADFLIEIIKLNSPNISKNFLFHYYLLHDLSDIADTDKHKFLIQELIKSMSFTPEKILTGLTEKQLKNLSKKGMIVLGITSKDVKEARERLAKKSYLVV